MGPPTAGLWSKWTSRKENLSSPALPTMVAVAPLCHSRILHGKSPHQLLDLETLAFVGGTQPLLLPGTSTGQDSVPACPPYLLFCLGGDG